LGRQLDELGTVVADARNEVVDAGFELVVNVRIVPELVFGGIEDGFVVELAFLVEVLIGVVVFFIGVVVFLTEVVGAFFDEVEVFFIVETIFVVEVGFLVVVAIFKGSFEDVWAIEADMGFVVLEINATVLSSNITLFFAPQLSAVFAGHLRLHSVVGAVLGVY